MIKIKLKKCFNCKLVKVIYKNVEGEKYCKQCNFQLFGFKKIKPIADKQKERLKKYMILRNQYLLEHCICEKCKVNFSNQVHHKSGKIGNNLYKDFFACCDECHSYIELHPEEAYENKWSIKRLNK